MLTNKGFEQNKADKSTVGLLIVSLILVIVIPVYQIIRNIYLAPQK
jgi:hypothetical protein